MYIKPFRVKSVPYHSQSSDVIKHFFSWNFSSFNVKLLVRLSIQLHLNVFIKFSLVEFDTSIRAYLPQNLLVSDDRKAFRRLPFGLWWKVFFLMASIFVKCGVRKRKSFQSLLDYLGSGNEKIHWSVFSGRDGMNNNFKFKDESPYRMTSSARPPALSLWLSSDKHKNKQKQPNTFTQFAFFFSVEGEMKQTALIFIFQFLFGFLVASISKMSI